jgi:tetratricopeptide (TPR) repeat protein
MGTSSDYTGGTGGDWTPYKHAASNFARHGGERRAEKVLARYVAALGGATAAAAAGRATGVGSGQAVAGFGAGVARDGLTPTLQRLGLGHLVGADRYDVLDGLVEALGGDGGTLEDQAVERAIIEAFRELYPDDAQTYEELEAVKLDQAALVRFIEHFVAAWAYARLLPTLAEKFSHIEDRETAQQRYDELRECMTKLVRLEIGDRDALDVAWRDAEGEAILTHVVDHLYEDMGDLE